MLYGFFIFYNLKVGKMTCVARTLEFLLFKEGVSRFIYILKNGLRIKILNKNKRDD